MKNKKRLSLESFRGQYNKYLVLVDILDKWESKYKNKGSGRPPRVLVQDFADFDDDILSLKKNILARLNKAMGRMSVQDDE
jgi:hypothetical protein